MPRRGRRYRIGSYPCFREPTGIVLGPLRSGPSLACRLPLPVLHPSDWNDFASTVPPRQSAWDRWKRREPVQLGRPGIGRSERPIAEALEGNVARAAPTAARWIGL